MTIRKILVNAALVIVGLPVLVVLIAVVCFYATATWARTGADRTRSNPRSQRMPHAANYTDCADDPDVVLYTLNGGGHQRPGGGPLPHGTLQPEHRRREPNVTFFREHRLPRNSNGR